MPQKDLHQIFQLHSSDQSFYIAHQDVFIILKTNIKKRTIMVIVFI